MKILNIDWMDDEKKVGILTLSTGNRNFVVFCFPCSFQIGDIIRDPLQSFEDKNLIRVDGDCYDIQSIGDTFESRITARVEDARQRIVSVGQIRIELGGHLPKDIVNGETVSFTSLRLQARKT